MKLSRFLVVIHSIFQPIQELCKNNLRGLAHYLCTVPKTYMIISTFCIITGFPVCRYSCTTELPSP